jgi:hypothetical protein
MESFQAECRDVVVRLVRERDHSFRLRLESRVRFTAAARLSNHHSSAKRAFTKSRKFTDHNDFLLTARKK